MQIDLSRYRVKLAETAAEREGAQRLRYRVFVEEMGARATPDEVKARREWDDFDPFFDHLILESLDPAIADPLDRVVGVYRLMRGDVAAAGRGFYGAGEYDLAADRGVGAGVRRAWAVVRGAGAPRRAGDASSLERAGELRAGAGYPAAVRGGELSWDGSGAAGGGACPICIMSILRPQDLRVRAQPAHYLDMNLMPREAIDAPRALQAIPPLIKAYLRLGGFVGDGAFVDEDFNTIDVCVVMDTGRMTERYLAFYRRTRGRRG